MERIARSSLPSLPKDNGVTKIINPGMKTLIAIPAYNEQRHIGALLVQLARHRNNVLVIDDGSTDQTAGIVIDAGFRCISLPVNNGLTAAFVQAGQVASREGYSHILMLDADGQHDPDDIPEFIRTLGTYDLVSGNRFHDPDGIPIAKIASNLFAILLIREVTGILLPDVACGYRGWKSGIAGLPSLSGASADPSLRFGLVYDMLIRHLNAGKEVGFVNIRAIYHPQDPVNTKITEILSLLSTILKFKHIPEVARVYESVMKKENFIIYLSGFRFEGRLVSDDAYLFETEPGEALHFFKAIPNTPRHEHKS